MKKLMEKLGCLTICSTLAPLRPGFFSLLSPIPQEPSTSVPGKNSPQRKGMSPPHPSGIFIRNPRKKTSDDAAPGKVLLFVIREGSRGLSHS